MKKVLLWHILTGFIYAVVLITTAEIESAICKLVLTFGFMVIASVGYFFIGMKECRQKVWITTLILLVATFVSELLINPLCRELYAEYPAISLLLFPYGGAQPFIQLGVYLAMKRIYFGVILGKFALFIPSVLTIIGVLTGRITKKVSK